MSTATINRQLRLAQRPTSAPVGPANFEVVEAARPEPGPGEFVVRNCWLSLDPASRGWMSAGRSYIAPVELGDVMRGFASGVVVASRHPDYEPGDRVSGLFGWQDYAVSCGEGVRRLLPGASLLDMLGPLGLPGVTAYFGLIDIGQPRGGETLLVSAAAGAVGSAVVQIGRILGCKVVGIAGGPEKCAFVESLGATAVDYKAADFHDQLRAACPDGVDVFFDNVGGAVLEAAIRRMNTFGRIALCGGISQYGSAAPKGPANYLILLSSRVRMQGFIYFDYVDRFDEAEAALAAWLSRGWLVGREEIVDGLTEAPTALQRLFDGANRGKLVVRISDELAA